MQKNRTLIVLKLFLNSNNFISYAKSLNQWTAYSQLKSIILKNQLEL